MALSIPSSTKREFVMILSTFAMASLKDKMVKGTIPHEVNLTSNHFTREQKVD
jgi:hypothetical protein